jgi:histidinol dehydrogenase
VYTVTGKPGWLRRGPGTWHAGVSLDSFQKHMTVQELTEDGLKLLGPSVAKMAAVEGLDAHRRAVTLRLGMGLDE